MIALIPARGGSKGVPKKNIKDFRGKPLIRWTVEAALESEAFDDIYVSSDSDEILSYCEDVTCLKRPERLAQDDTPMDSVIYHFCISTGYVHDVALLQPTSPLRNSEHIRQAKKQYTRKTLISGRYIDPAPLKGYVNGEAIYPCDRRQDLPQLFLPNGAMYMFEGVYLGIPRNNVDYFLMEENLDVDTEADFRCC